jgi:hypothetical protein
MKKITLGLATLSLLFAATSCNDETIETNPIDTQETIKFRPWLGKQTRATETTGTNLTGMADSDADGIPVAVFSEDHSATFNDTWSLYWNGTSYVYNNGTAINQPGGSVAYYAWYPKTIATALEAGATYSATGAGATLSYTVATASSSQEDLIAATAVSSFPVVDLKFNHILSQINFAIQGVSGVNVSIKNIKVNYVQGTGTYTFGQTGGSWATSAAASAPYAYEAYPVASDSTDYTTNGGTGILYLGNGSVYTRNNALMLLPQTFASASDGTFSFDFDLDDQANNTDLDHGSVTVNLNEYTPAWEMGKRYLYTIDFTQYLVGGPIVFNVSVSDWANATSTTTAQPVIVSDANKLSIEAAIKQQDDAKGATSTLTTFPIVVPVDLTAPIELDNISSTNFAQNDEIHISFPSGATGMTNLDISAAMADDWTITVSTNPVTLVKK